MQQQRTRIRFPVITQVNTDHSSTIDSVHQQSKMSNGIPLALGCSKVPASKKGMGANMKALISAPRSSNIQRRTIPNTQLAPRVNSEDKSGSRSRNITRPTQSQSNQRSISVPRSNKSSNSSQRSRKPSVPFAVKEKQWRIHQENLRALQRLQSVPRSYDTLKWRAEEEERNRILRSLAKQPQVYDQIEEESVMKRRKRQKSEIKGKNIINNSRASEGGSSSRIVYHGINHTPFFLKMNIDSEIRKNRIKNREMASLIKDRRTDPIEYSRVGYSQQKLRHLQGESPPAKSTPPRSNNNRSIDHESSFQDKRKDLSASKKLIEQQENGRLPAYAQRVSIPFRVNKVDSPGNLFDVTVFVKHGEKLMIKASGVSNVEEYFEIKVTDVAQCKNLLQQFNKDLKAIVHNLRVQNQWLVILKPQPTTPRSKSRLLQASDLSLAKKEAEDRPKASLPSSNEDGPVQ